MITLIKKELRICATQEKARTNERFFKTGTGHYGEGDIFIGVAVPDIRKVAKKYHHALFETIAELTASPVHEERLLGLLILVGQAQKADEKTLKKIFNFYIKNRKGVNNWDLVDLSADKIVGRYLFEYDKPTEILYRYAHSKNLWEKRIALLSTFYFIKQGSFDHTLKIAEILLCDTHDLIHKAVGWMLREVGKRDQKAEEGFLKKHYKKMPRTMLRYAIEKFPEEKRLRYLKELI
jgi:3-methyladenine DNA glycosylase AlkD